MAPHSSTLAWKIPWMVEPGIRSPWGHRVRHDWATSLSLFTFILWRRKWQPIPVFLPRESQGRRSLVGCRLWDRTESDMTEVTYQQRQQHHIYQWIVRFCWIQSVHVQGKGGDQGLWPSRSLQGHGASFSHPGSPVYLPAFSTCLSVPGCGVWFLQSTHPSTETWETSCPSSDWNCVGWLLLSFWFIAMLLLYEIKLLNVKKKKKKETCMHACSVAQSCLFCNPINCSPPRSSVRRIFQARILEWVTISYSRGSSRPRDWACVSCIGRQILYQGTTWEAPKETYPWWLSGKESTWNAGDLGLTPGLGRSPGGGHGYPLLYSSWRIP